MEVDFGKVDVSGLNRLIRHFANDVGIDEKDVVRQTGRTLARTLAEEAEPRGPFTAARKRGQATYHSDVEHVYMFPGEMFRRIKNARTRKGSRQTSEQVARAFYSAFMKGDYARAERILAGSGLDRRFLLHSMKIGKFDAGQEHQSKRSKTTGRVNQRVPSMILTDGDNRRINRYIKHGENKDVGKAKGVWASCSQQLGSTRGFPSWMVKAGQGAGAVEDRTSASDPYVVLKSLPDYTIRTLSPSRIKWAGTIAEKKMRKMMKITLEKRAAKLAGR